MRTGTGLVDKACVMPTKDSDKPTTPTDEAWLAKVYGAESSTEVESTYDNWASEYDDSVAAFGYTNFIYAAALLCRFSPPGAGEILDAGCGTGALGPHLTLLGYDSLVGIDLSRGMLVKARDTGCYRELAVANLGERLDFSSDRFAACVSFGVLTAGHAPPSALDELLRITRPGGHLLFSVSRPAFETAGFQEKLADLSTTGGWRQRFESPDYRPMPRSQTEGDLTARVYVYEAA